MKAQRKEILQMKIGYELDGLLADGLVGGVSPVVGALGYLGVQILQEAVVLLGDAL